MADNAFLHLSSWEATFEEASSQGALVGDIFGALFLLSRDGEAEELSDESLLEDFLALLFFGVPYLRLEIMGKQWQT